MVNKIFIDTGAFIALNDKSDQYHLDAVDFLGKLLNENKYRLFTSNLVIAETYTRILYYSRPSKAFDFLNSLRQSDVTILYSDKETEIRCSDFLKKYKNENISYADAVSFQLMNNNFIKDAFAFDWHFQLAGFQLSPILK